MSKSTKLNVKTSMGRAAGAVALTAVLGVSPLAANLMFAANAWAADASIAIKPADGQKATYDAYRIFTANVDDANKATNIAWDSADVKDAVVNFVNKAATDTHAAQSYEDWFKVHGAVTDLDGNGVITDDETAAAKEEAINVCGYVSSQIAASQGSAANAAWKVAGSFAQALARDLVAAGVTPAGTTTGTSDQTFTGAEGYYLFVTTAASIDAGEMGTAAIWTAVGGATTSITEKAQAAVISQGVKTDDAGSDFGPSTDAELNEDVTYRFAFRVPANYESFQNYALSFEGNLPEGMALVAGSVQVNLGDAAATAIDADVQQAGQELTVTPKTLAGATAGQDVLVSFKAKLSDAAKFALGATGNVCAGSWTYSADPQTAATETMFCNAVAAYTYGAKLTLTSHQDGSALAGGKFVVSNAAGNFLTATGFDGDSQAKAQVLETAADGTLSIPGLDADTYTITQISAAAKHDVIGGGKLTLQVQPTYYAVADATHKVGDLKDLSATVTGDSMTVGSEVINFVKSSSADAASGIVSLNVVNVSKDEESVTLATTGGAGVGIASAAVVAAGLGGLVAVRRRKSAQGE